MEKAMKEFEESDLMHCKMLVLYELLKNDVKGPLAAPPPAKKNKTGGWEGVCQSR